MDRNSKQQQLRTDILGFVEGSAGLCSIVQNLEVTGIRQTLDNKSIDIVTTDLEEVLLRTDTEGKEFLQVNLKGGKKILITEALIGFKPIAPRGLDSGKLPRVVTTPDIMSVFDAIQDSLHSASADLEEIKVLKRVYEAVVSGGEAVGFDLKEERSWVARIPLLLTQSAA